MFLNLKVIYIWGVRMENENKRFKLYEHKDNDYILDNPNEHLDFIEMLGDALTSEEIVNLLNELHEENEELKQENQRMTDKLNQLALEFLNYDMVTMGKATEISEMCYYDFLKYRKENGNPMELQL